MTLLSGAANGAHRGGRGLASSYTARIDDLRPARSAKLQGGNFARDSLNPKFHLLQSGRGGKEFRCVVSTGARAAEYCMERMQLQVAWVEKPCKGFAKYGPSFQEDRLGDWETGGWGLQQTCNWGF
jgi:hypothetical protein